MPDWLLVKVSNIIARIPPLHTPPVLSHRRGSHGRHQPGAVADQHNGVPARRGVRVGARGRGWRSGGRKEAVRVENEWLRRRRGWSALGPQGEAPVKHVVGCRTPVRLRVGMSEIDVPVGPARNEIACVLLYVLMTFPHGPRLRVYEIHTLYLLDFYSFILYVQTRNFFCFAIGS